MLNDQATTLHRLYCFQTEVSMRYPVCVEHNSVVNHEDEDRRNTWKVIGEISPCTWREVTPMFFNCLQMKLQHKGPKEKKIPQ